MTAQYLLSDSYKSCFIKNWAIAHSTMNVFSYHHLYEYLYSLGNYISIFCLNLATEYNFSTAWFCLRINQILWDGDTQQSSSDIDNGFFKDP